MKKIYQFDEFYKSKKETSSETKTEIPEVDKKKLNSFQSKDRKKMFEIMW
jgi:hypothetical protein